MSIRKLPNLILSEVGAGFTPAQKILWFHDHDHDPRTRLSEGDAANQKNQFAFMDKLMKRHSSFLFFVSVAVVGFMILCALQQLVGSIWFQKATERGNGGDIRLEAMKHALKIWPSHSFYWFSVGRELQDRSTGSGLTLTERRHLLEEAEKFLKRAIFLEPTASLYHFHLGWIYAALRPYEPSLKWKAHIAFSRAISLNPTHIEFRRAVAHYYLGQYALFLKPDEGAHSAGDLDWARKNFQRHFRAYVEMRPPGHLNRVLDRCFAVTQKYADLKRLIPDQPPYHLRLAEFLSQNGMWSFAREEFEIALSQDPTNPEAYHAYGSALFAHEQHEEALAIWKEEQTVSPQNPRSYIALSNAFWTLKREEEAIVELERLVDVHPDQVSYRLTLASRLEGAGNPEGALKAYREALQKDPNAPRIYAQMAGYWARLKDFSKAEASLERAISLRPSAVGYRDQLARLYFQQKRYARAVQEWQDALNQNPKFVGALKGIARSYEQLEAWSRALHYYKMALAIRPDDQSTLQAIERIKKMTALQARPPNNPVP